MKVRCADKPAFARTNLNGGLSRRLFGFAIFRFSYNCFQYDDQRLFAARICRFPKLYCRICSLSRHSEQIFLCARKFFVYAGTDCLSILRARQKKYYDVVKKASFWVFLWQLPARQLLPPSTCPIRPVRFMAFPALGASKSRIVLSALTGFCFLKTHTFWLFHSLLVVMFLTSHLPCSLPILGFSSLGGQLPVSFHMILPPGNIQFVSKQVLLLLYSAIAPLVPFPIVSLILHTSSLAPISVLMRSHLPPPPSPSLPASPLL